MTDTTREAVERLIALYSRDHGNPTFAEKSDTVAILRALLTRAEAAEAERDALQAKLALAVEGLTEIERLYYQEGKDVAWRAAHMRGIAADVLNKLTAEEINNAPD